MVKIKTKPTSKKSVNKKPKPKQLAPLWKHGNTSLIALVIVVIAIVAGGVGWMVARNAQAPAGKAETEAKMGVPIAQPGRDEAVKKIDYNNIDDCIAKGGSINNMDNKCYIDTSNLKSSGL